MTIQRLRIFLSSPGDVASAREIAAQTIERLAQDYARHFHIDEPYMWEHEAMLASGHFQDSVEPPSAFDIVVLILWSRLGTPLPEKTAVRAYRGIDGRAPVTGTEWEYEEALARARREGTPELLVFRSRAPAIMDMRDPGLRDQQLKQAQALDAFWSRHFANQGVFLGAYTEFSSDNDFARAFETQLRKLIDKRLASPATIGGAASRVWTRAPFRGLEAYEFEHAPIFFGQDEVLSRAMVQLVANAEAGSPFLIVLGASGSGKSSLVKAGIVPKLFVPRRVTGQAFLRRVVFRPSDATEGEDLFDALARRLTTREGEGDGLAELISSEITLGDLAAHLREAGAEPSLPFRIALAGLATKARGEGRMLAYESARLVLVVDQLEELFTSERFSTDSRSRFVRLLAGLSRSGLVWIVATMRKDFWHRADETPELARLAQGQGRLELLPPSPPQLSQMIRRPAEAAGVAFEVHPTTGIPLNEAIAEEVAREPGALPLLSYLLDQLYRADVVEVGGASLTYATHERLGRLEGAIAAKAEAVLAGCAAEDRDALGSVLFSLVRVGAADGDIERAISRRVPLSTFPPGSPQRRLVEALLAPGARLLVSDAEREGNPTVRVAHEALITRWTRALDFVRGNAEALKVRRRIEERYALWRALADSGQPASGRLSAWRPFAGHQRGLLTELDLTDARRLLREHRSEIDPRLANYIELSAIDDERIRGRSFRILAIVAGVIAVLALIASGAALTARFQVEQTLRAQSRLLVETASEHLKEGDVPGAQGIILEVLAGRHFGKMQYAAAINVFQEARAADRERAVLFGHRGVVYAAAFSPDGRRILTASDDRTARIWDAATGAPLAVLAGHGGPVYAAVFSPDGRRIVTASEDGTARLWDGATGATLMVLAGHGGPVHAAAFSPDGRRIVTASEDRTARVWDAASGAQLAILSGHDGAVYDAAFAPDGRRIVTASGDKTARIWDAVTGAQLSVLAGHTQTVAAAAFSPDGRRVVTASFDKTARIWDAASGAQLAILTGHDDVVYAAAFSPDGRRIVTASFDKTARIWDAATGAQLAQLVGHAQTVRSAAFSPDGGRIVTASDDKTARVWDAAMAGQLSVLAGHAAGLGSAAFSPDGRRIVTASNDKTARLWDSATGAQLAVLAGHTDGLESAAFSADGRRIVTASWDKTARIWDAATDAQIAILSGHLGAVTAASFSRDGRRIVTASWDKTARLWDGATYAQLAVFRGHGGAVYAAAFSPDGRRIVTASDDKTARIWDAASGAQLAILSGHGASVESAAFSPDGRRIVTASDDKTARIWDAVSGAQLAVLAGHGAGVESAAFSPDGRRIVTASGDKTARIWDARTWADVKSQILWARAAQFEPLSDMERAALGLAPGPRRRASSRSRAADALGERGDREEMTAIEQPSVARSNASLLTAFIDYAAAAARARADGAPENAWRRWRYRRATLARLLAARGMMWQVANAYGRFATS